MNKTILTIRELHNGNTRIESSDEDFLKEIAAAIDKRMGAIAVGNTEDSSGPCFYVVYGPGVIRTAKDESTNVVDNCFFVKIDLIEWSEDDVGQFQTLGFPRAIERFPVPNDFRCDDESGDEAIGDYIMDTLESQYRVKPILTSWTKENEDDNSSEH